MNHKDYNEITATEAADYVASADLNGVTLTPSGCGAAHSGISPEMDA